MRYALLMHYREAGEGEISEGATAEAKEAFGAYGRALESAGVLRSADVLQPSAATTTVTFRDGGLRVQDGPFAETKEALAGIFVLDVPDLDAAIGWAEKCPGAQLMLVCAHPAINPAVRTPLMLNTVLSFTAEQVGRAFSVPPATMATRLVRTKKRIKTAGVPFRIPDRAGLPARMTSVMEAVYGAYVIDWSTGPRDRQLPSEALQAEVLTTLAPGDAEAGGSRP